MRAAGGVLWDRSPVSSPQSRPSWWSPTIAPAIERAIVLIALLWIGYRTWSLIQFAWEFNTDDAFITLRYSRHLAEGRGLVWNPGEDPVEGYSNFTYVLLGAGALKAGLDPIIFLKGLGAGAAVANLLLTYVLARFWVGPFMALMAPALVTATAGFTWWTVSGLETPVYQGLLLAVTLFTLRGLGYRWVDSSTGDGLETRRPDGYHASWLGAAGMLSAVAGMTRPEGPLIFIAAFGAVFIDLALRWHRGELQDWRRGLRVLQALVIPFVVLYGGYFIIRWIYFGRLLPNTIYCKSGYKGGPAFRQHLEYWEEAAPQIIFAFLIPWHRLDSRHCFMWGIPLAYGVVLYRVDPIIAHYNRHFLAAHAFICIGVAIALGHIAKMIFEDRWRRYRAIVLVAVMLYLQGRLRVRVVAPLSVNLARYVDRMANREDVGMWLDARMTRDETFVIGDAGMIPYLARARVIDAFCLNSAQMTSPQIKKKRKKWVDWVLRQGPERIVVHSSEPNRLKPRGEYNFYPTLVKDGRFKEDYEEEQRFPAKNFSYFIFKRKDDALPPDRPDPNAPRDDENDDDDDDDDELMVEEDGSSTGDESTDDDAPEAPAGFVPAAGTEVRPLPSEGEGPAVRPASPRAEPTLAKPVVEFEARPATVSKKPAPAPTPDPPTPE